jgi:hypothetical protein
MGADAPRSSDAEPRWGMQLAASRTDRHESGTGAGRGFGGSPVDGRVLAQLDQLGSHRTPRCRPGACT